ncbi:MAG: cyclic nucleotide-binding domain-containing protein, partial [Actinomycetota bacterium]
HAIPLFADLDPAAREKIVQIAGELEAFAGQVLIQPKTAGSGMFVVEEGTVVVERDGREIELGPGQFFGELALLIDTPRTARVRARTDARLLAISREEFGELLEAEPRIALGMLVVLARRLAD